MYKPGFIFLSNSTKPSQDMYESREPITIDTFGYAPIKAADDLGYELYCGINRKYAESISCTNFKINFYNANIFRNVFAIKDNWLAYKNLCEVLEKNPSIKIIHCNTPIGGVLGRICGKKYKKKVVYTAHGFHFYKGAPIINWLFFFPVEKFLARWTDLLITINKEDFEIAKTFKTKKGGSVSFVPGVGINLDDYKMKEDMRQIVRSNLKIKDDDVAVFSMGDIVKRKNYESAIRAISETKNPRIHYYICGEGTDKSKMEQLSNDLGISKNVHFLGHRKDVKELLQGADIFLLTSRQEGLPRSLMEGMAYALPCVVSRIRGNDDLITDGEGGFLCGVDDYKGYASCLNTLSNSRELRIKMGRVNRNEIQKYELSNICSIVLSLFQEKFKL